MPIIYAQRFILTPDNIHSNKINLELYEKSTSYDRLCQTFRLYLVYALGFLSDL